MREEPLLLSSNRKAKSFNSQSKKLNHLQQKIVKKSLSSVFTPFTENYAVSDLSEKESSQISSISAAVDDEEVSDNGVTIQQPEVLSGISSVSDAFVPYEAPACKSREFQSSTVSLNQFISPSSVKSFTKNVEMSPASSTITTEDAAVFVTSDEVTTEEMTSFETELLVKLRESMFPVLHPADIKPMYKLLLDELAKMETQECYGLHEERGMIANLFSRKGMILLLSFGLGIFAVFTCYFLFTDIPSSSYGPPPT